jgi:hypothetical protein
LTTVGVPSLSNCFVRRGTRMALACAPGRAVQGFCVGLALMLSQLAPALGKGGGGGSGGSSSGGGGGGWSSGKASSSSGGAYAASGSNGGYKYSGSQKQGGSRTSNSGSNTNGGTNGVDAGSRCVPYLVLWFGAPHSALLARCLPADMCVVGHRTARRVDRRDGPWAGRGPRRAALSSSAPTAMATSLPGHRH